MASAERPKIAKTVVRTFVYLAIAAGVLVIAVVTERGDRRTFRDEQRDAVRARLHDTAADLSADLTEKLLLARGLASVVPIKPDLNQAEFSRLAEEMMQNDAAVVNIAAHRNYTIEYVHPFVENAHVIGTDLREVPAQIEAARKARRTQMPVVDGPVELLQGQPGLIIREPIFVHDGSPGDSPFWGLISVVVDVEKLFEQAEGRMRDAGLEFAARELPAEGTGTSVFRGRAEVFEQDPVVGETKLPQGQWQFAAVPVGGWATHVPGVWQTRGFFATLGIAALLLAWYLFRLQTARQMAHTQLTSAVEVMADGFVIYDEDDRLVTCNQKYKEIYDKSAPAMVPGESFENILRYGLRHGQYAEAEGREEEWLAERLHEHRKANSTVEQKLGDGRWLRILERKTPEGGRVGIRIDITEQVQSRERAERAERRLKDAIEALPAGFWWFDADDRLVMVNGTGRAQLSKVAHLAHPGARYADIVREGVRTGQYADIEGREEEWISGTLDLRKQDASVRDLKLGNGRWLRAYDQRTSDGGLVGFRIDITQSKRYEELLKNSNAELTAALAAREAAEKRFEDLSDIATEWFWEQDADLRFCYFSKGFQRSTGIDPDDLLGRRRTDFSAHDDLSARQDDMAVLLEKLEAREPFDNLIYQADNVRGTQMWVRTSGRPIFDANGQFKGYRGVAADVTPLYEALQQAQQANRAKTEFLNVISHELRTPLTVILGYNAFLANPTVLPAVQTVRAQMAEAGDAQADACEAAIVEIQGYACKIKDSGEQLMHLIEDVLDVARIEARTIRIEPDRVAAAQTAQRVASQLQGLAAEKALELRVEVDDFDVYCDDRRLEQVFMNLLNNAIKFTENGWVRIKAERQGPDVVFHVEDTGEGIPDDQLDRIFEQFSQVDSSSTRNTGGVGLGLTITKSLVELQGGWIRATNRTGGGSVFTFALPAWDESRSQGTAPTTRSA